MGNAWRVTSAAAALFWLATGPSVAMTSCEKKIFGKYAKSNELEQAYRKTLNDPEYAVCVSAASKALAAQSRATPAEKTPKAPPEPTRNFARSYFLLRQDFADIWLFQEPGDPSEATGANIAYTSDRIANNASWAAQGMAALVWQTYGDY